jgi:hypothetical protein
MSTLQSLRFKVHEGQYNEEAHKEIAGKYCTLTKNYEVAYVSKITYDGVPLPKDDPKFHSSLFMHAGYQVRVAGLICVMDPTKMAGAEDNSHK